MTLRLSRLFGDSAESWVDARQTVVLCDAEKTIAAEVEKIEPLKVA